MTLSISKEVELDESLQYINAVNESQLLQLLVITISRLII